jgi:hypothetical protein
MKIVKDPEDDGHDYEKEFLERMAKIESDYKKKLYRINFVIYFIKALIFIPLGFILVVALRAIWEALKLI